MDERYEAKLHDLERRILQQPGALDPAVRRAAAEGADVGPALATYVDKVRRHAYRVDDADVASLLEAGYSEDQVFELTVATAYGAARARLDAARQAMAGGAPNAGQGEAR